ncbi:MAG: hypothetical protein LBU34_01805 [Planctomycetaceae bacterium]|jgi:hypothetical protein|nr:hypothetical protein [Planctomycetaceae bacterium]
MLYLFFDWNEPVTQLGSGMMRQLFLLLRVIVPQDDTETVTLTGWVVKRRQYNLNT